tara:strand:+ start:47 stop:415 length:369 start_codon:yes stop_codon:yes gene_type:complete
MKTTLSTYEVTQALFQDENAAWSYEGAKALAELLEELETDCGTEQELDVVAIRCEFSEFESLGGWAKDYFTNEQYEIEIADKVEDEHGEGVSNDDIDQVIREYIQDYGMLIEFEGGIIVSSF